MGKKRRYIQHATKFAKKMFSFLDKIDGTADSDLTSSKIDTHISKITVTDRGNQTMSFEAQVFGPGDTTTANLLGDHVIYTVDGVTVHTSGIILIDSTGTGRNKNLAKTLNSPAIGSARPAAIVGALATDVLLTPGKHTIKAAVWNEANTAKLSKDISTEVVINRSGISFGAPAANYLVEGLDGNVTIDLTKLTLSGRQPGVEADYSPGVTHGHKIEVLNPAGTALALANAHTLVDGDTSFLKLDGAGADSYANLLQAALAVNTTLTVRVTAVGTGASGVALIDYLDHTIAIDPAADD
jgi:hypothetical protein